MREFKGAVPAAFLVGLLAGGFAGCQGYNFDPVSPNAVGQGLEEDLAFGRALKPNLMLVVDKSGSMDLPSDPTDPDCGLADGGICGQGKQDLCDPAACPTRWSELQAATGEFLASRGEVARMGLAVFPTSATCGSAEGTAAVVVPVNDSNDDSASLVATANQIHTRLQEILSTGTPGTLTTTGGGTPTGQSIRLLSERPELRQEDGREDLLVVLTDGVPNCNAAHPTPAPDPACRCTGICSPNTSLARLGCLDKADTVQAITDARNANLRTLVVGFGADVAQGDGPEVLNEMALAGGYPFRCGPGGATCPAGETCGPDNACSATHYYQASDRQALAARLTEIADRLRPSHPCLFELGQAPQDDDPRLILVYLTPPHQDPQRLTVGPDTFEYTPGGGGASPTVRLLGEACRTVEEAGPLEKIGIRIATLRAL